MTETQARSWAYASAAAGLIADALFIAFYVSFAVQHFAEPHGVTAILGSAADYAGIPQNALLVVITGVVFRFLSRQRRPDQALRIAGAMAFAAAAVCGVLTVTGRPGISKGLMTTRTASPAPQAQTLDSMILSGKIRHQSGGRGESGGCYALPASPVTFTVTSSVPG
jgi:uncharacterized membrane protein